MCQITKSVVAGLAAIFIVAVRSPVADAEEPLPDFMAPVPVSRSNELPPQPQPRGAASTIESQEPSAAKELVTKRVLPRGSEFGLLEGNLTSGLDGYRWQGNAPEPVHVEARLGLRLLLLPFGDANFGMYFNTEFGFPLRNVGDYFQDIALNRDLDTVLSNKNLNETRILSNHWDVSGGLHARFFGIGSGNIWRGLFLSLGYRGSVWGIQEHGIEAGFGIEIWKVRAGGSWYHSMSGPFKDLGGEFFGVRLEWRFLTAFRSVGF